MLMGQGIQSDEAGQATDTAQAVVMNDFPAAMPGVGDSAAAYRVGNPRMKPSSAQPISGCRRINQSQPIQNRVTVPPIITNGCSAV